MAGQYYPHAKQTVMGIMPKNDICLYHTNSCDVRGKKPQSIIITTKENARDGGNIRAMANAMKARDYGSVSHS